MWMFPSLAWLLGSRPWKKDRMLCGSRRKNEAVKLPAVREACSILAAATGRRNVLGAQREGE